MKVSATTQEIVLDIVAPEYDGGAPTLSYRLEWKLADETEFKPLSADLLFPKTIVELNDQPIISGTRYTFIVYAENKAGISEPSEAIEVLAAESPSVPADLTIEFFQADDTVKATWTLGSSNGAEISANKIFANDVEVRCSAILLTQCVIDLAELRKAPVSLELGQQLNLSVVSVNEVGQSEPVSASGLYAFVPQAPKSLQSDGSVTSSS